VYLKRALYIIEVPGMEREGSDMARPTQKHKKEKSVVLLS
jgi:hypothetical protein